MKSISANLTDKQWEIIEKIIEPQERRRKHSLREIINGLMYMLITGCQWRLLPGHFAPWQTVHYYFRKWKLEGVLEQLTDYLVGVVRRFSGRAENPSLGIIDSRSVGTSHHADPSCKGIDGNKKVKGRKQHIVVDSLGLPLAIDVHPAYVHDSKGAMGVIAMMRGKQPKLKKIIADGGYRGELGEKVRKRFGWEFEVVLRSDNHSNEFRPAHKRWVVERSFSWLENFRRLTTDYEFLAESSVAIVQLAFIRITLNKII